MNTDTGDDFDSGCRYIMKQEPPEAVACLLDIPSETMTFEEWLDARRVTFPGQPKRTCDTVAHLHNLQQQGLPWAIAIEFQSEPDPLMFGRAMVYLGLLWMEYKYAIGAKNRFQVGMVVVNLTGRGNASRDMIWDGSKVRTTLGIREINFSQWDALEAMQRVEVGTMPRSFLSWVPLMQSADEQATIERWKLLAEQESDGRKKSDLATLALLFAEAAKKLPLWQEALKGWGVMKSVVAEGFRVEGRVETIRDLVEARFGVVSPELDTLLNSTKDALVLKRWVAIAAMAASTEDLLAQLKQATPPM